MSADGVFSHIQDFSRHGGSFWTTVSWTLVKLINPHSVITNGAKL